MGEKLDIDTLKKLQWKIMENVAASALIPLMRIGDELGLFATLQSIGPASAEALANAASIDARYAREWLLALSAAGYVTYTDADDTFHLSAEQAAVFADENSPALMIGAYDLLAGMVANEDVVKAAFPTGEGVAYERAHPCIFQGTARFFKPSYATNLIAKWLPKVDGVVDKLQNGGRFADIGCGFGVSTMMIAEAFPQAEITGFDIHADSIASAKKLAADAGLSERIQYHEASAKSYPGEYDVLAFFDCLHDMGDPLGAAHYACEHMREGGVIMLIEPSAKDNPVDNMNTIGQMYYSFSTMGCVPTSKSQEVGLALGAQAGPARLCSILQEAGFRDATVAHKTATNMVIAARK
jgi:ubiquinone/menaquinone biosynthesis C-methylase UbiE